MAIFKNLKTTLVGVALILMAAFTFFVSPLPLPANIPKDVAPWIQLGFPIALVISGILLILAEDGKSPRECFQSYKSTALAVILFLAALTGLYMKLDWQIVGTLFFWSFGLFFQKDKNEPPTTPPSGTFGNTDKTVAQMFTPKPFNPNTNSTGL